MLVHAANITQKETHKRKYKDVVSKTYMTEIRGKYDEWHQANTQLIGPTSQPSDLDQEIIGKRVKLLEEYKNFIDQQKYAEHFDSRSNLHSSVMEEFIYYLFRDLIGVRIQAQLQTMFLSSPDSSEDKQESEIERHDFDVPAIAIECKTYLDKTMLEGASRAA